MSILIIGVGEFGARVADKINQEKIAGVNCAVVVTSINPKYNTINKGVNIWDGEMRHPGGEFERAKINAEVNKELIRDLIIEGTSDDWNLGNESQFTLSHKSSLD